MDACRQEHRLASEVFRAQCDAVEIEENLYDVGIVIAFASFFRPMRA